MTARPYETHTHTHTHTQPFTLLSASVPSDSYITRSGRVGDIDSEHVQGHVIRVFKNINDMIPIHEVGLWSCVVITFTFSNLADAFIQSDLQMRTIEATKNQQKSNSMQVLWQVSVSLTQFKKRNKNKISSK